MKSKTRTYLIRRKLQSMGLTDAQLERTNRRIWSHIRKWYGSGQWDWPTLYAVYPQLACTLKAIADESFERMRNDRYRKP